MGIQRILGLSAPPQPQIITPARSEELQPAAQSASRIPYGPVAQLDRARTF